MSIEEKYQSALDLLYSYVDYSLKHSSELAKAEFNLDRMRDLMRLLGDPQDRYKVIHITGTKGKGSTAAMCASGLRAAGFKVGLYTSPHLLEYTERIQVDNQPISKRDLVDLVDRVRPLLDQVPRITTFEITTALSFLYFANQAVDWAVVEVGLGGRLDATNIVHPQVSVITTVSYDHTAVLGDTLAQIATEKGGIIKPGKPVVIGPQKSESLNILLKLAERSGSQAYFVPQILHAIPLKSGLDGQSFIVQGKFSNQSIQQEIHLPLLGNHQVENALIAFTTLLCAGLTEPSLIAFGFSKVDWQCRFEIAQSDPMLIFDSAHNEDAFSRLAETIRAYLPGKKIVLILGVSEDKHLVEMIAQLSDLIQTLIITRADHPRALSVDDISMKLGRQSFPMLSFPTVDKALPAALELGTKNGNIVISAGSMFVTAEAKRFWLESRKNAIQ